jgi:hypothetical protein
METIESEEVGGCCCSGCRAFPLPGDSGNVIIEDANGTFPTIVELDEDILLSNGPGEFQVRVGDGPLPVMV